MKYFIANWKAHKNVDQSVEWTRIFAEKLQSTSLPQDVEIVICPPSPFLFYVKQLLSDLPGVKVGLQDISQFEEGKHTGEVAASMVKESIQYAIIGHSERRSQLNESESAIALKIEQLQKNNIKPILCVRNEKDVIYEGASLVAYEPIEAIGTGHNMPVDQVLEMKKKLQLKPEQAFIYGGSANPDNQKEYLASNEIDGFLVGTASLDPIEFLQTIVG